MLATSKLVSSGGGGAYNCAGVSVRRHEAAVTARMAAVKPAQNAAKPFVVDKI